LIGCGGVTSAEDALEFIMAGASAVQIGTASLTSPRIPLSVLEGIESFMREDGTRDLTELIGIALF